MGTNLKHLNIKKMCNREVRHRNSEGLVTFTKGVLKNIAENGYK